MKYTCPVCKIIFNGLPARAKRSKNVFCSKPCYDIFKIGKGRSPETCKKMSLSRMGEKNHFYGKKHTQETKDKISKSRKNKCCGKDSYNWMGGRRLNSTGYIEIRQPYHHRSRKNSYVPEQVLVAEKQLGRYLDPTETPHHINSDKTNNKPRNLFVFENSSAHAQFHLAVRWGGLSKFWLKSNII